MNYISPAMKTFKAFDIYLQRGSMSKVWDENNKEYIDWMAQNLCILVGHSHPKVLKALINQTVTLPHCTTMFNHREPELLAKELIETLTYNNYNINPNNYVVHFLNSGAEAVDLAVRMARVHTQRKKIVALEDSFHGLHGFAADVTEIAKFRQIPLTNNSDIIHIPRDTYDYVEIFGQNILHDTNNNNNNNNDARIIAENNIAGIIAEPIQGYGGVKHVDNINNMFEYCNNIGGVTICDEIQTGFGRLGTHFWGFQKFGLIPDIIVCAKGMGNGMGIISAVISRRNIAENFSKKVFFNTQSANPTSCAVARATIRVVYEENLMQNCLIVSDSLVTGFKSLQVKYPSIIYDIRGAGLLLGLELNKDICKQLQQGLLELGHIVGFGGSDLNVMRVQPPLSISLKDAMSLIPSLDSVISKLIIVKQVINLEKN
jgi:alanine-glyoxylate transaminase/(R)-3-amino-2-methylpropionate-pyruvate transaminase